MRVPPFTLRLIALTLVLGSLVMAGYACGQKGPLYLPEEAPQEEEEEPKKKD